MKGWGEKKRKEATEEEKGGRWEGRERRDSRGQLREENGAEKEERERRREGERRKRD